MTSPNIKEKALKYLDKKLKHARIALGKAGHKNGSEREIEGLTNKIEVLGYLMELVQKEDGRQ